MEKIKHEFERCFWWIVNLLSCDFSFVLFKKKIFHIFAVAYCIYCRCVALRCHRTFFSFQFNYSCCDRSFAIYEYRKHNMISAKRKFPVHASAAVLHKCLKRHNGQIKEHIRTYIWHEEKRLCEDRPFILQTFPYVDVCEMKDVQKRKKCFGFASLYTFSCIRIIKTAFEFNFALRRKLSMKLKCNANFCQRKRKSNGWRRKTYIHILSCRPRMFTQMTWH